jgi:CO/xanthine dehydrogenase Mo-binding subunit
MTVDNSDNKWIGKRTPRPDGADKVTGRAAYAADTNMPGMLWGKVLRSPHAHARIKSIDTSKAEALPGVHAVITSKDIVDFPIAKGPVMLGISQHDNGWYEWETAPEVRPDGHPMDIEIRLVGGGR